MPHTHSGDPSAAPLWNCWRACTCCLANNDVSVVISGFEEAGKHGNVHSASRVALVWPRLHFRVTIGIARFQLLYEFGLAVLGTEVERVLVVVV